MIWVVAVMALVIVIGVCCFAIGVMVGHDQAHRTTWTYRDERRANEWENQ